MAALKRLTEADFLLLDDLGGGETENAKLESRLLFLALEERQTRRKATLITTNLTPAALIKLFGTRVLGRVQPLTIIHVDHKRNFRLTPAATDLW